MTKRSRSLGPTENKSAFRHDMNIYMSVTICATLRKTGLSHFQRAQLYPALKKVVLRNSPLATLILHDTETDTYRLEIATALDLSKNVVFQRPVEDAGIFHKAVCEQLSRQFRNISSSPPWLLWVTPVGKEIKVIFFFHHSLFDGTSGKAALLGLRDALNDGLEPDEDPILEIPATTSIHPSIEDLLDVEGLLSAPIQNHEEICTPSPQKNVWTAAPALDVSQGPIPTKALIKHITAEQVNILVGKSKAHKTSITALITAVAMFALDQALTKSAIDYTDINFSIPRNLRPLIKESAGLSPESLGDYVSSIDMPYTRINDINDIWQSASEIRSGLLTEIEAGSDLSSMAHLFKEEHPRTKYTKRFGVARDVSLEMSTLLINESPPTSSDGWHLDDFFFIQGVNSDGSPVTCSAISFRGGSLNVSFAWGSEIVPDIIMERLTANFAKGIAILAKK